jgi:hypothetical protein
MRVVQLVWRYQQKMMLSTRFLFATLIIVFLLVGCETGSPAEISLQGTDTATPLPNVTSIYTTNIKYTPTETRNSFILSKTSTLNVDNPRLFIGLTIPPLPPGLYEEFGAPIITGEAPGDEINYHLFLIRMGEKRMLWLATPIFVNDLLTGTLKIRDSVLLPQFSENDKVIPYNCRRTGQMWLTWGVVALVQVPDGWPENHNSPATNVRSAWVIDRISTSLQSISPEGIECFPLADKLTPILQVYERQQEPQECVPTPMLTVSPVPEDPNH